MEFDPIYLYMDLSDSDHEESSNKIERKKEREKDPGEAAVEHKQTERQHNKTDQSPCPTREYRIQMKNTDEGRTQSSTV